MVKCANYVCSNEVKTGFKTETYCRKCSHSEAPFIYCCDVCKQLFSVTTYANGHLAKSCSETCRKIKRSIKANIRYRKQHKFKEKKCPTCHINFTGGYNGKSKTKYCSLRCTKYRAVARAKRIEKAFKINKPIVSLPLYLS
jgi:hypothetical protein